MDTQTVTAPGPAERHKGHTTEPGPDPPVPINSTPPGTTAEDGSHDLGWVFLKLLISSLPTPLPPEESLSL